LDVVLDLVRIEQRSPNPHDDTGADDGDQEDDEQAAECIVGRDFSAVVSPV
jgi:hypothetical protein